MKKAQHLKIFFHNIRFSMRFIVQHSIKLLVALPCVVLLLPLSLYSQTGEPAKSHKTNQELVFWYESKTGKYGFTDEDGATIVPPIYDGISSVQNGTWLVRTGKLYGLLAKSGKEIIPPRYDSVKVTTNSYVVVGIERKFGVVNNRGKEIIPPEYDRVQLFHNGWITVAKGEKLGCFTIEGKRVLPTQYDEITFLEGRQLKSRKGQTVQTHSVR
jgi:hypothetical protein